MSRAYFFLVDAAALLGVSENDLLHYGAQGRIPLVVALPEYLTVTNWQKKVLPGRIGASVTQEIYPTFLELKPSYCQKVETNGETRQSEFPHGYYLQVQSNQEISIIKKISPSNECINIEDPEHVWITVGKPKGSFGWEFPETHGASPDRGSSVYISKANLIVFKESLHQLKEKLALSNDFNQAPDGNEVTAYACLPPKEFKKLFDLIGVAEKMWRNADPKQRDTQPDNSVVIAKLREKGFSENMASVGCSIIRPEYAPKGGRRKDNERF
ncbi:hypothetical protein A3H38_01485 [candidate division WOR-1 bacterium RIFCSPLOWO2_02_FULL_46_20]|uniref:Uncharacterized protein n=1 Tax=candidate division WOR-1 bacterium RIFCSPLOWO2_02_FULL_46_20 TaxID=1802567 RepID=A0A1F4RBS4_UNCSA|nr:MAG: hypothetical protein A3H38_01485 [candidate division WOR-1 bacterium RIFCSPLOWO2_02_FULL_46_20]